MKEPIICFDFDGTLLDDEGRIHPKDIELLKLYSQFQFVVTTGRSRESVRRSFNINGLYTGNRIPIPMILLNGSLIYDSDERLISYHPFPPETQFTLINLTNLFTEVTFLQLDLDQIRVIHPSPFGMEACEGFEFETIPFSGEIDLQPFSKLMCISPEKAQLEEFSKLTAKLPVEKAYSLEYVLEITPLGINKAAGLHILLDDLNIKNPKIFAAGDGGNDLPLFNLSSLSFAPKNSPAVIQRSADQIIYRKLSGILSPMISAFKTL